MKFLFLLLCFAFLPHDSSLNSFSNSILQKLYSDKEIDEEQFSIHKKQLEFRHKINLQGRIDSMKIWDLDILYIEEFAFKKDSFLVTEYYFSSKKEVEWRKKKSDEWYDNYYPDKYFENGKLTKRYFFYDDNAKEHISSIRKHMKRRKPSDKIDPINKRLVIHAGCGMTWKYMKHAREKANEEFLKPQTPDYFLIETLIESNSNNMSFQKPVKTKIKAIVEGTSF